MSRLRWLIFVTRIDASKQTGNAQLRLMVMWRCIVSQGTVPGMSAVNHHTMRNAGPRSSNRDQRQHRQQTHHLKRVTRPRVQQHLDVGDESTHSVIQPYVPWLMSGTFVPPGGMLYQKLGSLAIGRRAEIRL